MINKKEGKKRNLGKIRGVSIHFFPYSEIKNIDSTERIKKILSIIFGNNILILQGRLKPEEETRLIGDTMAMIGHVKNFKGIELAVISGDESRGFFTKIKKGFVDIIAGGDLGALTIIGPATFVKEIKRNPQKIELLLNE